MRPMLILSVALVILSVVLSIFVGAYGKARDELGETEKKYVEARAEADELRADNNGVHAKLLAANARISELEAAADLSAGVNVFFSEAQPPERKELFDTHTNMYRYMDYQTITAGDQYKLQQQCMTRHNGIRALPVGDELYYCAALGNAFGDGENSIGMAYKVTLRNGYSFNVVFAEFKHPIPETDEEKEAAKTDYGDPDYSYLSPKDENGRYVRDSLNVVEFIVDIGAIPENARAAGTMSAIPAFGGLYSYDGDIVEMKHLGRVWEP